MLPKETTPTSVLLPKPAVQVTAKVNLKAVAASMLLSLHMLLQFLQELFPVS